MMNKRGMWVEVAVDTPPLTTQKDVEEVFKRAKELSISDIYLQVWREGYRWFEGETGELSPHLKGSGGFDPLAAALALSGKSQIRLHAWINVFNAGRDRDRHSIVSALGPGVLLTDNMGTRIDAYSAEGKPPSEYGAAFQLGTPGLWIDPGNPKVLPYLEGLVSEIFTRYPALNGLHLDFFRFPYLLPIRPSSSVPFGFDFGYGDESVEEFCKSIDRDSPFEMSRERGQTPVNYSTALLWDEWRRAQLERYLEAFRAKIGNKRELSVAVIPWADRAYLSAYQNWRRWLLKDLIDCACLMSYTRDHEMFRYLAIQAAAFRSSKSQVLAGIGTYVLPDQGQIEKQDEIAKEAGVNGVIYFSYGDLRKR